MNYKLANGTIKSEWFEVKFFILVKVRRVNYPIEEGNLEFKLMTLSDYVYTPFFSICIHFYLFIR